MKKNVLWLVVVITAALVQTTLLDAIKLQGVLPDLMLLLVVYFGIADGEERAMWTGVVGGLYQDIAGDVVIGHHVLCNVIVGYAAGRIATRLITEHPAVKIGSVFFASIVYGLLDTSITYVQQPGVGAIRMIASSVIPSAFYTAILTPVVFWMLARIFHGRGTTLSEVP